ncbi:MAG: thiol-disulfide isomerase [Acidobacteria bacterium]|nr:MAG: thiol-disulfide isomerase [Acidobacteriota bacterium]
MAPFSLVTFKETKPWALPILDSIKNGKMPPWFADPCCGRFANSPLLSRDQIATMANWLAAGAPAGDPKSAPPPPQRAVGWNIATPDLVLKMPAPVRLPAQGDVEYTYEIVPTNFTEGKWVAMSELRPSARNHVHHAVVYIRPPGSNWLRGAPVGVPFMAKLIPARADLIFQIHYTTNGHAATDQTSAGLVFSKQPPKQRVLTLQLANDHDTIPIPPNTDNYRVEVSGTLPNDALLLSFFPHMHLRGKKFEYNIVHADGGRETLLRVNYDFFWQLSYVLAEPRRLPAGTKLEVIAWYDNSKNNPHNPDPNSRVEWGDQTFNEMMVGFFDVAVPAEMDKEHFFIRSASR